MTTKQLLNSLQAPDGSEYICLTDGSGNLITIGTGSVSSVSVVTANGVSGSVTTPSSTPAITLTLGAITPTSVAITPVATASLPGSPVAGQIAIINDQLTTPAAKGVAPTGGGSVVCAVIYNGSGWVGI